MSKKFCTCRPRLSSYDNSSACVAMCFKLRRLGVYKVKKIGMDLKNQGSDEKCYNMRHYWYYSTTMYIGFIYTETFTYIGL